MRRGASWSKRPNKTPNLNIYPQDLWNPRINQINRSLSNSSSMRDHKRYPHKWLDS
ncbi:unnamed protein product [Cyberlindnera jadinii]|uniref:Uncharacterized protein n=1 Tax=Cyberlindnera jadinii (strain ATCC 18201 / CBS 1600 / BCRC 20928 / JCM 3617 / NBRC 0987 / NRRL Y-1542) TaxID=983966 RepID=A0A0H5C6J0_CYBJN|nr:unnamed protein product [Cyberlindnera jadinii]